MGACGCNGGKTPAATANETSAIGTDKNLLTSKPESAMGAEPLVTKSAEVSKEGSSPDGTEIKAPVDDTEAKVEPQNEAGTEARAQTNDVKDTVADQGEPEVVAGGEQVETKNEPSKAAEKESKEQPKDENSLEIQEKEHGMNASDNKANNAEGKHAPGKAGSEVPPVYVSGDVKQEDGNIDTQATADDPVVADGLAPSASCCNICGIGC